MKYTHDVEITIPDSDDVVTHQFESYSEAFDFAKSTRDKLKMRTDVIERTVVNFFKPEDAPNA